MKEELYIIFVQYGWVMALIALAGVVVLGVLKYANAFKKLEEKVRHVVYLAISIGISAVGSVIYLACMNALDAAVIFGYIGAVEILNQAAYALFKATTLNDLMKKLLDVIAKLFKKKEEQ